MVPCTFFQIPHMRPADQKQAASIHLFFSMILVVLKQFEFWHSTLTYLVGISHMPTTHGPPDMPKQSGADPELPEEGILADNCRHCSSSTSVFLTPRTEVCKVLRAFPHRFVFLRHRCPQNCAEFYRTIIMSSKGTACVICLLFTNNIQTPVYFISENVVPTPCEFYKIPSCKHFCHKQNRSFNRPSWAYSWDKSRSEDPFWSVHRLKLLLWRGVKDNRAHSCYNANQHFKQIQPRGC